MFDPKSLMEEQSLAQIAWRSRRLPWNGFNLIITGSVGVLSSLYVATSSRPSAAFAEWSRSLSLIGIAFAAQVLGFLIAGFTIFATLTKPELFRRMAVITHKESQLSYLKYNFFTFVQVFIHYLSFTAVCLMVGIVGASNGPLSEVVHRLCEDPDTTKALLAKIAYVVLCTWSVYILVALKSFIFNIYHVVMTAIRWDYESSLGTEKSQQPDTSASDPPKLE